MEWNAILKSLYYLNLDMLNQITIFRLKLFSLHRSILVVSPRYIVFQQVVEKVDFTVQKPFFPKRSITSTTGTPANFNVLHLLLLQPVN